MATAPSWRDDLIEFQRDRCHAFSDRLRRLDAADYPTDLPRQVIAFMREANTAILEQLEALSVDPDFLALEDDDAEVQLLRYSLLYTYLPAASMFIERSQNDEARVTELILPVRRILERFFADADLLLYPLPEINYSFLSLGRTLREVLRSLDVAASVRLPEHLYAVAFAGLHGAQFLLHALLGHEVGHALTTEFSITKVLLTIPSKDDPRLTQYASELASLIGSELGDPNDSNANVQLSLKDYFSEVQLKARLTRGVTKTFEHWLDEIACDVIGFALLGPAFLFAAIEFLPVLHKMDRSSTEYPPTRFRLRLIFRLLNESLGGTLSDLTEQSYLDAQFPTDVAAFFGRWSQRANEAIDGYSDLIHAVAHDAIEERFPDLVTAIHDNVAGLDRYDFTHHRNAIGWLRTRIRNAVPPNELQPGDPAPELSCIMNAGWFSFLSDVRELRSEHQWNEWQAKLAVHSWTARAVESSEIVRRWNEVKQSLAE